MLGVLGVIGSLIFVALEIRENTRATRSATIQDISRWSYDTNEYFMANAELQLAYRAACEGSIDAAQRQLLLWWFSGFLKLQANRFYQTQLGTIDESTAFGLGGRGGVYTTPMFKQLWPEIREGLEPDFQEFVERELLPMSSDSCVDWQ